MGLENNEKDYIVADKGRDYVRSSVPAKRSTFASVAPKDPLRVVLDFEDAPTGVGFLIYSESKNRYQLVLPHHEDYVLLSLEGKQLVAHKPSKSMLRGILDSCSTYQSIKLHNGLLLTPFDMGAPFVNSFELLIDAAIGCRRNGPSKNKFSIPEVWAAYLMSILESGEKPSSRDELMQKASVLKNEPVTLYSLM